jgi:hypothetical protein
MYESCVWVNHTEIHCQTPEARKPPRQATHDEYAGAFVQGGQKEDGGGESLSQRDEREHLGHGDSLEEQRGVGAKALPHDGRL